MSSSKQQRTAPITSASRLSPPSARLTTRPSTPEGVPLWFHGLLARSVAEDLLLKNPQSAEGLFLVRQSSNRGGHFVISVCTGQTVNHYLVETLESMFYVRRDRCEERGRDIQARDLCSLVHCYRASPLDESGLILKDGLLRTIPVTVTAPLTAMTRSKINHNYIPLHMDNREYIALEDFTAGDDLQALSFRKGEVLTVLQKESRNWWFAYNAQQDLGYIPASLVSNLKEWKQKCQNSGAFCNLGCSDSDGVFVSNREKTDERREMERRCLLDVNSNVLGICCGCSVSVPASPTRCNSSPSLQENSCHSSSSREVVCVSADYIALCLRHREHQKLCEMQRVFDARLSQQLSPPGRNALPNSSRQSPPDCRRDLKPRPLQRSHTEPANIHSAPPSPHRRTELGQAPSHSKMSKENVPCLLVSAVSVSELSSSAMPDRNNCNNKQHGFPRSLSKEGSELKLLTCFEEGETKVISSNCSAQTDGKLEPGDTHAANGEISKRPDSREIEKICDKPYDPVATYLRLAECTTGPQSAIR
ncbi:uncharacterized protein LOC110984176 isoform X2 [Acanthaster planci]|nr:uncharacterized protein LOC110984176 isoform X2 [Acanthaster planci]XP_022099765.1 uncharacterized protein LOC110984176 isoform X2 [Acanthaster planci]XP_022099766.1 uncharacterized protein LOC110984176 isoform X2 [Acanthaster planci]